MAEDIKMQSNVPPLQHDTEAPTKQQEEAMSSLHEIDASLDQPEPTPVKEEIKQEEAKPKEEPKPTKPVEEPKSAVDPNSRVYPYTKEKQYNYQEDETLDAQMLMPSDSYKNTLDFTLGIGNIGEKKLRKEYVQSERISSQVVTGSLSKAVRNDVFKKSMDNNEENNFANNMEYGDKALNTKFISFADTTANKITGKQAVARFTSILGGGNIVQVPLWHSGIWVTIKPPTQSELVILENKIKSNAIELGMYTNTLIFSNYSVIYSEIVYNFIIDHILDQTINVAKADLLKYIKVNDFNLLVCGILSTMYPEGVAIQRACRNAAHLADNGKPMCDYVHTAQVDPKKLIWVNKKALTKEMYNHMLNRKPDSASVEDVLEYQKQVSSNIAKVIDVETSNNVKIQLKLLTPTMENYLINGRRWVDDIISDTEELFTDTDTEEGKNNKIDTMVASNLLGIYNVFVNNITTKYNDTVIEVAEYEEVNETLSVLTADEKAYSAVLNAITDYIGDTGLAVVATPDFVCPNCKATQIENKEKDDPFKNFIPLNVLDIFFDLCTPKTNR